MPLVVTKDWYLVSSNQTKLFAAQVMSAGQDSIVAWVTVSYYNSMILFGYLCLLWAVGG